MSLRDELVQQQAEKEKEEKEQAHKLYLKQQTEKEAWQAEVLALYEQVQAGDIPQEWKEIYDRFVEKIKEKVANGAKDFRIEEDLSEEKYLYYADFGVEINKKRVTRKDMINKYLTARLQMDGFFNASFELVAIEDRYSTEEDRKRQSQLDAERHRAAMDKYERDFNRYHKYTADDMGTFGAAPVYATPAATPILMSGVRYTYKIIAKGSLYDKEPTAQPQPATGKQKALSILVNVVGLVCIALTVWLGIFSWKAYHEVWGVILHVMAGIFLFGGLYNLSVGIFAKKGVEMAGEKPSADKGQGSLIAGIAGTVIAVVLFLILNHVYGFVGIFLAFGKIFK